MFWGFKALWWISLTRMFHGRHDLRPNFEGYLVFFMPVTAITETFLSLVSVPSPSEMETCSRSARLGVSLHLCW